MPRSLLPPRTWKSGMSGLALLDEFDGVADGLNRLGGIVGNLDAELLLESHDQFDVVETVGAEIINEACLRSHLFRVDPQVLDNDLLHPLCNVTHVR